MRTTIALASALVLAAHGTAAPPKRFDRTQETSRGGFTPASYRGVRFGVSQRRDVERIFGKPRLVFQEDSDYTLLSYRDIGVVPGRAEFGISTKNGRVKVLIVYPDRLSKEDGLKLFGPGYHETHWATADCLSEGGSAPMYRAADGRITYLEYPRLGIALHPYAGRIDEIIYLDKPLGGNRDPCKGRKRR